MVAEQTSKVVLAVDIATPTNAAINRPKSPLGRTVWAMTSIALAGFVPEGRITLAATPINTRMIPNTIIIPNARIMLCFAIFSSFAAKMR